MATSIGLPPPKPTTEAQPSPAATAAIRVSRDGSCSTASKMIASGSAGEHRVGKAERADIGVGDEQAAARAAAARRAAAPRPAPRSASGRTGIRRPACGASLALPVTRRGSGIQDAQKRALQPAEQAARRAAALARRRNGRRRAGRPGRTSSSLARISSAARFGQAGEQRPVGLRRRAEPALGRAAPGRG